MAELVSLLRDQVDVVGTVSDGRSLVEAAVRQHQLLAETPEATLPLIAAARYLAAHSTTTRSQRQTFDIARRLHRGETLYKDE